MKFLRDRHFYADVINKNILDFTYVFDLKP